MHTNGPPFVAVRAAELFATSARGDAPTYEPTRLELLAERRAQRRRTRASRAERTRLSTAAGLRRLADALAPAQPNGALVGPYRSPRR